MKEKSSDSVLGVDIREIQKRLLEILLEFHRICEKHNIKYQLYSGTLIGAIRHKGFIPWDDDIDVCMLRSEYEKFLSVVDDELSREYFFQSYETDPEYINKFPKIRKNGTIFMEKLVEDLDMHHGLYIDIFPFDNIKAHTIRGKLQLWALRTVDSFLKYRIKERHEGLEPGFEKTKAKFKYNLINILPVSKLGVERWSLKTMKKFNDEKTEFIGDLANPDPKVLKSFMMRRESMEETINWEFEGHEFPVSKAYDEVLTRAYGDYMTLPKEEDRVSHHDIVKIDLGWEKKKD